MFINAKKKKGCIIPKGCPYASLHYMYRPLMCPFAARKKKIPPRATAAVTMAYVYRPPMLKIPSSK
jgi:hypothetical protein